MSGKVVGMFARQYIEAAGLPLLRESIEAQIRRESEEAFKLEFEPTVFFVPEAFKKPYREIFPILYARVSEALIDQSRLQNALVEVLYDFVTRWGSTFEHFEEHHRVFLFELCDRTVAKENNNISAGQAEEGGLDGVGVGMAAGGSIPTAVWLRRLGDEVLRTVEQDLRVFRGEPPTAASDAAVAS
jgi:hypothetical protein